MKAKNGFTVVELLIVVAILSILASMVIFGTNKALREGSRHNHPAQYDK